VSRALRGSYEISAETRKLVLEYAEKLNYRPNPIALRRSEAGPSASSSNTQYLASRSVDGLLVSLSTETTDLTHLTKLHDRGLPIVFFDRIPEEMPTHKVIANNFNGAYQATEHLIRSGFTRIAHLTISPYLSITKERLAGYKAALADHKIGFDESLVKYCKYGGLIDGETEEAVESLLSLPHKPDALVAASDKLSTGCPAALARRKVRVPEDMAIVGFTNSQLTDIFHPALTSVRQPAFEMGQVAISRVLNTELTVRSSSVKR
jgi:LacI family transcriptional regulator